MIENKAGGAHSPEGRHFGALGKEELAEGWRDDKNRQSGNPRKWKKAFSKQWSGLSVYGWISKKSRCDCYLILRDTGNHNWAE